MIAGKNTLLTGASITVSESTTAEPGQGGANLLNENSLVVWGVTGTSESASFVLTAPITADAVALFGVVVTTSIKIDVYSAYPATISDTVTVSAANLTGLSAKSVYLPLTAGSTIAAIKVTVNNAAGTDTGYAGWLWAGKVIDFGCAEALAPADVSNDSATITRGNNSDENPSYEYQTFDITTKKDVGFETLRANMRALLAEGYAKPRPFLINEPVLTTAEVFLGIMDSGKIQYDLFKIENADTAEAWSAQTTIGLREIRGTSDNDN